jgi:hypothetical protein
MAQARTKVDPDWEAGQDSTAVPFMPGSIRFSDQQMLFHNDQGSIFFRLRAA